MSGFHDSVRAKELRRRRGAKWALVDSDVIPAWVADMDFPIAEPIQNALRDAIETHDLGYPPLDWRGTQGIAACFAERAQTRWGWEVAPERVMLLTDVVQGIYLALHTLVPAGQGVVVQPPVYPPFFSAVQECGHELLRNPLQATERGYAMDLDGLRELLAAHPHARVLLLCNPQNPTGRAFTRAELESLGELVELHDLWVISDEIHADLVYSPSSHVPFASLGPELQQRTLTLTSASKAFNLAGLRCAVAVCGSEAQRAHIESIPAHMRGDPNVLGRVAMLTAWQEGDSWLAETLSYLDANRRFLKDYLGDRLPQLHMQLPEATYLAWIDCAGLGLEPDQPAHALFLQSGRVALSDGAAFGREGAQHVRINFATSRALLTEIVDRMARAVAS